MDGYFFRESSNLFPKFKRRHNKNTATGLLEIIKLQGKKSIFIINVGNVDHYVLTKAALLDAIEGCFRFYGIHEIDNTFRLCSCSTLCTRVLHTHFFKTFHKRKSRSKTAGDFGSTIFGSNSTALSAY